MLCSEQFASLCKTKMKANLGLQDIMSEIVFYYLNEKWDLIKILKKSHD